MQGQNAINGRAWRKGSWAMNRADDGADNQEGAWDLCMCVQIAIGVPVRMAVHRGEAVVQMSAAYPSPAKGLEHLERTAVHRGVLAVQMSAASLDPGKVVADQEEGAVHQGEAVVQMSAAYLGMGVAYLGNAAVRSGLQAVHLGKDFACALNFPAI